MMSLTLLKSRYEARQQTFDPSWRVYDTFVQDWHECQSTTRESAIRLARELNERYEE